MITGQQRAIAFMLDPQSGGSRDKQHPFVMILIVRRIGWGGLAGGDDPLDANARTPQDFGEKLLGRGCRGIFKEIIQDTTPLPTVRTRLASPRPFGQTCYRQCAGLRGGTGIGKGIVPAPDGMRFLFRSRSSHGTPDAKSSPSCRHGRDWTPVGVRAIHC